jgi:hypothetical protein
MLKKRLSDIDDVLPAKRLRDIEAAAKKTEHILRTFDDRSASQSGMALKVADGFTHRDEANALIAMAVRNGPLETLHAGKYSAWLEDDALSRVTDDEMKILMMYATRMLATLLKMRDETPEIYRRYIENYGSMYCNGWERIQ